MAESRSVGRRIPRRPAAPPGSSSIAGGDLRSRLSTWLLRPFLDLGPLALGPLYARGIEKYYEAFADRSRPPFLLQRTLPPGFRLQLASEAREPAYRLEDPRQLPAGLRTDRWSRMCDALEAWRDIASETRRRLIVLLHSLCIYQPALRLVRASSSAIDQDVDLAYWRASAQYVLEMPDRLQDYRRADLSTFESIAVTRRDSIPAAFNAAVKVFVHKAKIGASLRELKTWSGRAERALADAVLRVDAFTAELLTSRYYRALGFLPQRRGDRAEVARVMDLAERHARRLEPRDDAQELLYLENLHPVMESRTKEALWQRDLELALARAREVIELDPYDSKAWVELGEIHMLRKQWSEAAEAYLGAAMLGPPASAVGRHMAGICFRELGQDLLAAFLFKEALEVDPLGLSPREEIRRFPDAGVLGALREWNRRTVEL